MAFASVWKRVFRAQVFIRKCVPRAGQFCCKTNALSYERFLNGTTTCNRGTGQLGNGENNLIFCLQKDTSQDPVHACRLTPRNDLQNNNDTKVTCTLWQYQNYIAQVYTYSGAHGLLTYWIHKYCTSLPITFTASPLSYLYKILCISGANIWLLSMHPRTHVSSRQRIFSYDC